MHKRIHSSFGYLTPAEFEQHRLQQQASEKRVRRGSDQAGCEDLDATVEEQEDRHGR